MDAVVDGIFFSPTEVRKILFLFVALLFPVLIYLFLQGFGENQFDIPVYYQDGIDTVIVDCGPIKTIGQYHTTTLYMLDSDSAVSVELENGIVLYDMFGIAMSGSNIAKNNMLSFLNKYKNDSRVSVISINNDAASTLDVFQSDNLNLISMDSSIGSYYAQCILILDMANPNLLVLVDDKRRIRGYFDASQLEEIDRLNTELYILLDNSI